MSAIGSRPWQHERNLISPGPQEEPEGAFRSRLRAGAKGIRTAGLICPPSRIFPSRRSGPGGRLGLSRKDILLCGTYGSNPAPLRQ